MKYRIFTLEVELDQDHPRLRDSLSKARALGYSSEASLEKAQRLLHQRCGVFRLKKIARIVSYKEYASLDAVGESRSKEWLQKAESNGCWIELC